MNKKISAIFFLAFFLLNFAAFAGAKDYPAPPYKELVFPPGQIPSSHSPSIVELPDGELFTVWHAAWSPKAVIWSARKPVGADKWTEPSIIHQSPGYGVKNPVLYLGSDKKLFLFWGDEKRLIFKFIMDRLRMKTSTDYGRTWDEARDVAHLTWFLPRTNLIKLNDGRIVLPIYTDLSTSSAIAVSKDGGITWSGPKYILFFLGLQPTIIQRSDSSLFTLMRTGMWPRLCWQAVSHNFGFNWGEYKTSDVKNPGSSLEMLKLRNGHVVLAFNDSKTSRVNLSLALSYDEGRTWARSRVIEDKPGGVNMYPSLMQDRDGLIHVVYSYDTRSSIAHFVTDEKWIEGKI